MAPGLDAADTGSVACGRHRFRLVDIENLNQGRFSPRVSIVDSTAEFGRSGSTTLIVLAAEGVAWG